jgi:hypothetical protein
MKTIQIPLFPLHTVLFPGGPLPMRVFETRYLDMISNCMKTNTGFGVCMIVEGKEVGKAAKTHVTGTVAIITDWHMGHEGLLGITTNGERRFRIASVQVQPDQLSIAKAELLPEEPEIELPDKYLSLVDLLRKMLENVGHHYEELPRRFGDANWVSFRLAELLPISLDNKQSLLEMDDPLQRLEYLFSTLEGLQIS